jgi:hypothetical protein
MNKSKWSFCQRTSNGLSWRLERLWSVHCPKQLTSTPTTSEVVKTTKDRKWNLQKKNQYFQLIFLNFQWREIPCKAVDESRLLLWSLVEEPMRHLNWLVDTLSRINGRLLSQQWGVSKRTWRCRDCLEHKIQETNTRRCFPLSVGCHVDVFC